ncbi:hypothetical protein BV898_14862 [Hypsibius exemplaris]|uniref:NADH dehydrogenase [ubiquinone] 1 subunit C2 n=1 Tax=Hypsibius exemplaris TaxID=2072580 RepID=A0A9X6NCS3_HYPEX|nr:hypothetical protein BV898_14862 [Hypsibius exemplaris]
MANDSREYRDGNNRRPYFMRTEQIRLPREQNFITNFFRQGRSQEQIPALGAAVAVGGFVMNNRIRGLPPLSRPYMVVLLGLTGYWAAGWVDYWQTQGFAHRDAQMHHYMSLHPEDFTEEPAPKLKYVLYPWQPIREHWDSLEDTVNR